MPDHSKTNGIVDIQLMRRTAAALIPAPPERQAAESRIEYARQAVASLGGASTFGAALAFSAFYTGQTSDHADPIAQKYLAWSFAMYMGGCVVAFIWTPRWAAPSSATYSPVMFCFRLLASCVAGYCIVAGTILLGLVLAVTPSRSVQAAGYMVIVVIATVEFGRISESWREFARAMELVAYRINVHHPLNPTYRTICHITRLHNNDLLPEARDIGELLIFHSRFAYATDYVLSLTPQETVTTSETVMAKRIAYASRAFNHAPSHSSFHVMDTSAWRSEEAAALSFLRLFQRYGPLVRQLLVNDPYFWGRPLDIQISQVYLLHLAGLPASTQELDATKDDESTSSAFHLSIRMDREDDFPSIYIHPSISLPPYYPRHARTPPAYDLPLAPSDAAYTNDSPDAEPAGLTSDTESSTRIPRPPRAYFEAGREAASATDGSVPEFPTADAEPSSRIPAPHHVAAVGEVTPEGQQVVDEVV